MDSCQTEMNTKPRPLHLHRHRRVAQNPVAAQKQMAAATNPRKTSYVELPVSGVWSAAQSAA